LSSCRGRHHRGGGRVRAGFYFYFPNKQAVLAELVRRAVGRGQQAAQPWTGRAGDPIDALRAGIEAGAALGHENAWTAVLYGSTSGPSGR
jgi:AcrR family transcriptional regulator